MTATRALVTGANGFIGSSLLRAAAAANVDAVGLTRRDADYGTPAALAEFVRAARPEVIMHAAGGASVAASVADPAADLKSSVILTQQLLEAVRRSGLRPRIVFVSSAAVYGNPLHQPVDEQAAIAPVSPYGRHKAQCEQLLREHVQACGGAALALRAFSLFGSGQRRLLLWEICRQQREAAEVVLRGTGDEERDYLHVDDFAALAWRTAVTAREPWMSLNVASGHSLRVRELAEKIGAALGTAKPVRCENRPSAGDPAIWRADVERLRALLGDPGVPAFETRLVQVLGEWTR